MKKDILNQFDCYDCNYIEKHVDEYSKLIGLFVIRFSELEDALNIAIAETFVDDDHSIGYRVIKTLTFSNKVNLFYEIHLEGMTVIEKSLIKHLKKIKSELEETAIFRNRIAHANWSTLDKDGYVRTKIEANKNDGAIEFLNIKILPANIEDFISKANDLVRRILLIGSYQQASDN